MREGVVVGFCPGNRCDGPAKPLGASTGKGATVIFQGSVTESRGEDARMEPSDVLLELWREVGRHLELGESVDRLLELFRLVLPADLLILRRLDTKRGSIETIAAAAAGEQPLPQTVRCACAGANLQRIRSWASRNELRQDDASILQDDLPGLVPSGVEGNILARVVGDPEHQIAIVLAVSLDRPFESIEARQFARLLDPVAVAVENDRRIRELNTLKEAAEAENRTLLTRLGRTDLGEIIGAETGLREVMERVNLVATSDLPVLILGETGSGKEVIARAVHKRSGRATGPFLRVNCGAIPSELIDSELFGHERGSFTGAVGTRKGWFERADGGTLFLDEIGELPLAAQVRLLRVLQEGTFERVGGEKQISVNVRIVAATHRDLRSMVGEGTFREDLWYRIATYPITLPSLRERPQDVAEMAKHFAQRAAKRFGMPSIDPSTDDIRILTSYDWPGNVRELQSVIERAAILGNGQGLDVRTALGTPISRHPRGNAIDAVKRPSDDPLATLDAVMVEHIERVLARTNGVIEGKNGAAQILGINPHTLRARMRKLGVRWQRFRVPTLDPTPTPAPAAPHRIDPPAAGPSAPINVQVNGFSPSI